jgi:hypothetical protein
MICDAQKAKEISDKFSFQVIENDLNKTFFAIEKACNNGKYEIEYEINRMFANSFKKELKNRGFVVGGEIHNESVGTITYCISW